MDFLNGCCNAIIHSLSNDEDVTVDDWKYEEKPTLISNKNTSVQSQRSNSQHLEDAQYETCESYMVNKNMPDDTQKTPKISPEMFQNFMIPSLTIKKSMDTFYKQNIYSDYEIDGSIQEMDELNLMETNETYPFKQSDEEERKQKTKEFIRCTTKQQKRSFIEQELIDTEESYYNGLQTLLNDLIKPMFVNKYIDKTKYYKTITSSLPEMKQFHYVFLNQLKDIFSFKSTANVFNTFIYENKDKFIKMYIKFVSEYETILDLFGTTFHDNQPLQQFLKTKRKEKKPLSNLLILPVQRVPRYILLLTDLKKNTDKNEADYKDIDNALCMITEITEKINSGQRKIENLSQCLQIQHSLTGLKEPIVDKDGNRKFEAQFIFIKKEANHQRQFFVFNDIIIIANNKWIVKQTLDIRTVEIKIIKCDNNIFSEFKMITSIGKPTLYLSKSLDDINEFQKIVEMNRTIVWDKDLQSLDGDVAQLRTQLVLQKSDVMEFVE